MAIKYSCFISHRHGQERLAERIVTELYDGLAAELDVLLEEGVYLDRERLKGGDYLDEVLASAICQSACMVVVYTPRYFSKDHPYCTREFMAMKTLEEERLNLLGPQEGGRRGLIINVIFRGQEDDLPPQIKGIKAYNFSEFQMSSRKMSSNSKFAGLIREIAEQIAQHSESLAEVSDSLQCCAEFGLPSEKAALEWLEAQPALKKRKFPGR